MRSTKKLTLSATVTALGAALLALGGVFEVLDLSVSALASLFVVFVYIEIGSPYTWLVWLATSLSAFVIFPASPLWIEYLLIFGFYPILKAYIERLLHPLWIPLKLLYVNAVITFLFFTFELIFKTPLFSTGRVYIKAGLWVIIVAAFFLYDVFLNVLIKYYFERFRSRIKHLLK